MNGVGLLTEKKKKTGLETGMFVRQEGGGTEGVGTTC